MNRFFDIHLKKNEEMKDRKMKERQKKETPHFFQRIDRKERLITVSTLIKGPADIASTLIRLPGVVQTLGTV